MAKRFLLVCTGVLMLAIAYHLVSPVEVAQSQEGERAVLYAIDGTSGYHYVLTDQGNFYGGWPETTWNLIGSWPGNPPTATQPTTWGEIKAEYGE
ncbi:hypothetical protein ACFL2Z_00860 [Candidatus Eisenbacteria bacterium]|uniref:Uncharacterized protein n=1 Tax=Eiseniibacteriota bacterium TaxID=2212470 RepID=A0ABV6YN08_UNCEI